MLTKYLKAITYINEFNEYILCINYMPHTALYVEYTSDQNRPTEILLSNQDSGRDARGLCMGQVYSVPGLAVGHVHICT